MANAKNGQDGQSGRDEQDGRPAPILVPVDFSDHSAEALRFAAAAARTAGAPLVVLHVVHDPADRPGSYAEAQDGDGALRTLDEAASRMLNAFLDGLAAAGDPSLEGVNVERRLVSGIPVTRILETAEQVGARLIVMGSQGKTGLEHLLMGSTAEQVVRLAAVPVTIVKARVKDT